MPVLPERRAALALEVNRGRIEEHHINGGEQIAPARKELLFDHILAHARSSARQRLPQPPHRPIQLMQLELLSPVDPLLLLPALRGPIAAWGKESVQHRQEHRPLERELEMALSGQRPEHLSHPALNPQPLKNQGRANTVRAGGNALSLGVGTEHRVLLARNAPESR